MSHPIYLTKTSKAEFSIYGLIFIGAVIATLVGLFGFTKSPDVVAEHAVEQQENIGGMATVTYVDEQNNYFVSDGKHIWDVKMAKGDNGWSVQHLAQVGSVSEAK